MTPDKLLEVLDELRGKKPPLAIVLTTNRFAKGKTTEIPLKSLARWIPELKDNEAVIFVINPYDVKELMKDHPEMPYIGVPVIDLDR